jgi:hypothetical protein
VITHSTGRAGAGAKLHCEQRKSERHSDLHSHMCWHRHRDWLGGVAIWVPDCGMASSRRCRLGNAAESNIFVIIPIAIVALIIFIGWREAKREDRA